MGKIVTVPLPHDLPENWANNQYVSPGGSEVGLTPQHGYNYLMQQVNRSQQAVGELDNAVGGIPNKNLLDNGYFVGGGAFGNFPVNRLGRQTYAGIGPSIDRWLKEEANGRVTVAADYVTFTGTGTIGYVFQGYVLFSFPCTLSVLLSNGELYTKTFTSYDDEPLNIDGFLFYLTVRNLYIEIPSSIASLSLKAIKLELGTVQTLVHQENNVWVLNEIPNYAEQMAKCTQYDVSSGGYIGFSSGGLTPASIE